MLKDGKNILRKIKSYHIIFFSCLLCIIFIINSVKVNKERSLLKLSQTKEETFKNILPFRNLQYQSERYSQKVCPKASKDLNEYYRTGDLSKINLYSGGIVCEDKDKAYMQNLIALVKNANGDDDDNESGDSIEDSAIDYSMRFIPMAIFLVFGLFGLIGWFVCCVCTCCNCCCCCCCKKSVCKKVFFIITYAFYALVVAICIYGLSVTNKSFTGLGNTCCSFLKFFEQVLDGEINQDPPYWAGVNSIHNTLIDLRDYISDYGDQSHQETSQRFLNLDNARKIFLSYMNTSSIYLENNINDYSKDYTNKDISTYSLKDTYILDIVNSFGKVNSDGSFSPDSILDKWHIEFSQVNTIAMNYLEPANNAFNNILEENIGDVIDKLNDAGDNIDEITQPFEDLNEDLGEFFDSIVDIGNNIVKMALHFLFSFLMFINIGLGTLVFLICFCSMKQCTSCCCCRCLLKCGAHATWNILSLIMILSFIFGSLLGIVGIIGGDMMSLITYILSEDNFNDQNSLLLNELGEAKDYLRTFIHGNGDISQQLNLGNSLDSFDVINGVQENIRNIRNTFMEVISQYLVYNATINWLNGEKEFINDTFLIPKTGYDNSKNKISYFDFIQKINHEFQKEEKKYKWDFSNYNNGQCQSTENPNTIFNIKTCKPITIINELRLNNDLKKYAEILSDIETFLTNANEINYSDSKKSFIEILNQLRDYYRDYLTHLDSTLETFDNAISNLMNSIRPLIGEAGNFFSFLNGRFISTNIKIILIYLKNALGKDIYSIGVALCIVGCSLTLSISSTLILLAIINEELKQHIQKENTPNPSSTVIPFGVNNATPFEPQKYGV